MKVDKFTKKKNKGCEKSKLRIGSLNICRGLFSKELAIKDFIDSEEIEIFSLSETDLEFFDTQKPFGIKGFRTFYPLQRKEDNDIKRMLVFVKEYIEVTQRIDLMSKSISTVWLEIRGKNEKKNPLVYFI